MADEHNITKAELGALTESITKNVSELRDISLALNSHTEIMNKILSRLYNGMSKDIVDKVCEVNERCVTNCINKIDELKTSVSDVDKEESVAWKLNKIKSDLGFTKWNIKLATWFLGIFALVVAISVVTVRVTSSMNLSKDAVRQIVQEIQLEKSK